MKVGFQSILKILLFVIIATQLTECRKDETETSIIDSTLVENNVGVSFYIIVVDENHEVLNNATLSLSNYGQDIPPNDQGIYILNNLELTNIGQKINVNKDGFLPQIKMLTGENNSKNIIEIILIKEPEGQIINTGEASTIDGGGELLLPPTLVNTQGSPYSGEVRIKSRYFDPDHSEYIQQAPGNMIGLNANNEYVVLGSLGMYSIELSNPVTGEELKIPPNNTATLSFPIAENQKENIPKSIPLWSMDEDMGIWIYEGEASLIDDKMVAIVSHFSFWNCDLPYYFVPFCATFVDRQGNLLKGLEVDFSIDSRGFGHDYTNDFGKICGKIPRESIVDLSFFYDNTKFDETQIGEFFDTPINITIEIENLPKINGIVLDCNQLPVTNGYGIVTSNNSTFPIFLNGDGYFEYFMLIQEHQLTLVNQATNEFTETIVGGSISEFNVGQIEICNTPTESLISGKVMIDNDEDGISDIPVNNAVINVKNVVTGLVDYTTTTNIDGAYLLQVVPMIEYELTLEEIPGKKTVFHGDNTPDDGLANEAWTNKTRNGIAVIISDPTELDEDNDFQLINNGNGIVSGSILIDVNGDLIGDMPASNLNVQLISFTKGTEEIKSATIDANGEFYFDSDNFIGEIRINISSILDFDTSADPDGNDQALGANNLIPIRLRASETDADNNFVIRNGSVTGSVFEDLDNDDVGDAPIEGFEITIHSVLPDFPKTTTTDENGNYQFTNLLPGEYSITAQDESEIDEDYVDVFDGDESPEDINDAVDGLNDDLIKVVLEIGELDADNNFVEEQLGSISGNVSEDTDIDGIADIPGNNRTIQLHFSDGQLIATAITDANGDYEFNGIAPGEYYVQYNSDIGFEIILEGDQTPDDTNDEVGVFVDGAIPVTLIPGEDDEDNNFVDRKI